MVAISHMGPLSTYEVASMNEESCLLFNFSEFKFKNPM